MEGALTSTMNPKAGWSQLQLRVHPELRRLLKSAAALEDQTMEEYLHRLLCDHFGRLDLVLQAADAN